MNISIRKSKHQKRDISVNQFKFATECIINYCDKNLKTYQIYIGSSENEKFGCDVYTTKTQISAVVYHG